MTHDLVSGSARAAKRMSDIPRSGIRGVLERVGVGDFVNLAGGDPSFPTPEHICAAAYEASRQGDTHYTHGRGAFALREAFAAKLERENGLHEVDPETEILVAAGALNALAATFLALLDPGDEVLVPDPGFANYQAQVILAGGRPVPIPLSGEDGFVPSLEALRAVLTPRARAIAINSPANPTGAVYPADALQTFASFAAEHDLIVVSDEAYEHLVYPPATHVSIAQFAEARDRTVSIFSLSKTYAMTGWRVGFAVAPPQLSEEIAKVLEHVIGCASSVSQAAGLAGLNGPFEPVTQMVAAYGRRRQLVIDAFEGLPGVRLVPPLGAFYAFPDVGEPGEEIAERLASEVGVLVVPGSAFGARGRNHIRLSFAGAEANLAEGLRRLRAGLQR